VRILAARLEKGRKGEGPVDAARGGGGEGKKKEQKKKSKLVYLAMLDLESEHEAARIGGGKGREGKSHRLSHRRRKKGKRKKKKRLGARTQAEPLTIENKLGVKKGKGGKNGKSSLLLVPCRFLLSFTLERKGGAKKRIQLASFSTHRSLVRVTGRREKGEGGGKKEKKEGKGRSLPTFHSSFKDGERDERGGRKKEHAFPLALHPCNIG